MKKTPKLFLLALVALAFTACNSDDKKETTKDSTTITAPKNDSAMNPIDTNKVQKPAPGDTAKRPIVPVN